MLIATFAVAALFAAAPGAKQVETKQNHQSETMCAGCAAHARAKWIETRRDNPHSTVVENANAIEYLVTNEEFSAAETGNPYSVDFRYSNQGGSGNGDVQALEAESPHNAQPARRAAVALRGTTTKCGCMLSDARTAAAGGQH